jgi:alpha-methylacyl-CoA racemase
LALGAIEAPFVTALMEGLGLPVCASREQIAEVIVRRPRDEWVAHFEGRDACVAPVLEMSEALYHPHHIARKTFREVAGVVQPGPAPRYVGEPMDDPLPPREPGEDGRAILEELGFTAPEIDRLLEKR